MRIIILLALAALLSSCCTQRPAVEMRTETRTDTTYIDVPVYIPGGMVRDTLCLTDTITAPGEIIIRTDTTARAQLRWWRTAYGKVVAECAALEQTRAVPLPSVTRTITETKTVQIEVEKHVRTWAWWDTALAAAVAVLLLVLLLIAKF